jgi:hypothetical protein
LNKSFEGLSFLGTAKIFWGFETRESRIVMVNLPFLLSLYLPNFEH